MDNWCESVIEEVKHAALGSDFSHHRARCGGVWIYGYSRCGRRDCQFLVLPVPGNLPDFFCYRDISRQKGPVTSAAIPVRPCKGVV